MNIVLILILILSTAYSEKFGPFNVVIKEFASCLDEGTHLQLVGTKLGIIKRNAPLVLSTNLINRATLDDSVDVTIGSAVWGNGGWKENFWKKKLGGWCSGLGTFVPDFLRRLLEAMDCKSCSIPPGNHTIKNLDLKLDVNLPIAPYGKYRADIKLGNRMAPKFGCFYAVYEILPKKRNKN